MKRDICHYYDKLIYDVFEAYKNAAQMKFGKNTNIEPFHTISFGLNYSFKYNMNGGACTVHLMPYGNGTAVDVRYTIVQLFGARYGAYDRDLTEYVEGVLGVKAQDISIPVEQFLAEGSKVVADNYNPTFLNVMGQPDRVPDSATQQPMGAYVQAQPAQPVRQQAPQAKFCGNCGTPVTPGANFCGKCGSPLK